LIRAPQQGRKTQEKDHFYAKLQEATEKRENANNIMIIGDMNDHVGTERAGMEHIMGAFGIGNRNKGDRMLDFCMINNVSIMNTFYQHKQEHKFSWYRWN
jgi:exonuclease III